MVYLVSPFQYYDEGIPQGAAIHLAAPCRIPVRNEYTMRPLSHNAHIAGNADSLYILNRMI